MTQEIKVYRDLMGANAEWAGKNRALLAETNTVMVNLISAPGSGKTTLLEHLAASLGRRVAVLEGDVETTRDAERLAAAGVPVCQLLTSGGCHLEAKMVHAALNDLPLAELDLVVVENVGNLVCPAEFDLGERAKIALLSVTEGEDKPIKYPLLFREAAAVVLTKTDLLPYLPFDLDACLNYLRQVQPEAPVYQVSALSGAGLDDFAGWLRALA